MHTRAKGRSHRQRSIAAEPRQEQTSVAASILREPSLAREMAGAGEARSTGPVAMKALAEATHVARTARGYAMEYIAARLLEKPPEVGLCTYKEEA